MSNPTFDQIPSILGRIYRQFDLSGVNDVFAVRDLWGRIRFFVEKRPQPGSPLELRLSEFARVASEKLGAHGNPEERILDYLDEIDMCADDLAAQPHQLIISGEQPRGDGQPPLYLLDSQITGLSWGTVDELTSNRSQNRVALYSLKGGVGRSTATAVAAWHLAREGKNVLVIDLDLEAPGLSSSLLPNGHQSDFGIIDWFVEDAVGEGDKVLHEMIARSPLAEELPGEILVAPCHGKEPGEFIAKLGRCYLDLTKNDHQESWEKRLLRLLEQVEQERSPDVVLLDTRSGLPDLASTAVTELADTVFLFGVGSVQTWSGYRLLFDYWYRLGVHSKIREKLKMVSALIPETNRDEYSSQFRQDAWNLFIEFLYEELGSGEVDGFNYDLDDISAPHNPLEIFWNRGFSALTKLDSLDAQLVAASYGRFLEGLDRLLVTEREAP